MIRRLCFSLVILFCVSQLSGQTVIKLRKGNGNLFHIPCKVNNAEMEFIFDTGASTITMSLKEAEKLFLEKNLKRSDIIGKTRMSIADGQVVDGVIINIKELVVGDLILKDIDATIVSTQNAPLLFCQSAIKNFGEFSFDYATQLLKINNIKKHNSTIKIPVLREEVKKGLQPNEIKEYEEFFSVKHKILSNLSVDFIKYSSDNIEGDLYYFFHLI